MESQIIKKIKAELAAFEEKKQAFIADLRKEFPTMFKDIFETAPNLKSVSWRQYTPYFNDGETCYFSAHTDDLEVNGLNSYDDEDEENPNLCLRHIYTDLRTEEDVRICKEVAAAIGYDWYKNVSIGSRGLAWNPDFDASVSNAVKAISDVLDEIPDSFLEELFGDHVRVTITSNGNIEVDDYEHD